MLISQSPPKMAHSVSQNFVLIINIGHVCCHKMNLDGFGGHQFRLIANIAYNLLKTCKISIGEFSPMEAAALVRLVSPCPSQKLHPAIMPRGQQHGDQAATERMAAKKAEIPGESGCFTLAHRPAAQRRQPS